MAPPQGIPPSFQFQPRASDLLHHIPHTMEALREHEDPRIEQELTHLAHVLEQRDRQVENFLSSSRGRPYAIYTYTPGAQGYSAAVLAQIGARGESWYIPFTLPAFFSGSPIRPAGFGLVEVYATYSLSSTLVGTFAAYVDYPTVQPEVVLDNDVTLTGATYKRTAVVNVPNPLVPPATINLVFANPMNSTQAFAGAAAVTISNASLIVTWVG